MQVGDYSDRAIGAAVIGTGFGCLTHVGALRKAGFDVIALVGRDPGKTAERAQRLGIPNASTSLEAALDLPGVDAVTIATPPHTHAQLALDAMARGRHVICEKPLARNADEARLMLDAANTTGVVHLVGSEFRWSTGQALAAKAISDGAIGMPRIATFLLHIPLLADPGSEVPDWWSQSEQGGGWLGAHAVHLIDQIRMTLGEFDGVSAGLSRVADREWTAEDAYTLHFRLRNGVEGVMQSSSGTFGPIVMISRISGSQGTLWIEGDSVRTADRAGTRILEVPRALRTEAPEPPPADMLKTHYDMLHSTGIDLGPYTRLAETFRDLILGNPVADFPPPATFADGLAAMEVIDAARRSAALGTWESVGR